MSPDYTAPLQEMRFVIDEVLRAPEDWARRPAHADLDAATAAAVIEEGARFAVEVLAPTDAVGDRQGCRLDAEGRVRTPEGYAAAYAAWVEGGWPALAADPRWGGQGLPQLLDFAVLETLLAANHAWTMFGGLLHGAVATLSAHGAADLQRRFLPDLVSGRTLAAMALTEPQAGSDLSQVRCKGEWLDAAQAELAAAAAGVSARGAASSADAPAGAGAHAPRLRVSGSKLFISGADHDLTPQTLHLVLLRLPGAPAGSAGLSLALVPTRREDGGPNGVHVDALEHKLGLHGSPTCAVRYEAAEGWLIGAPGRGLAAMFVMMNAARLQVAMQGLAHLEHATQRAWAYAAERRQGRAGGPSAAAGPAALAEHPAVRRMLWTLRALTEGLRVVCYRCAQLLDEADGAEDAAQRTQAATRVALLTPVLKAFATHHGFQGVSLAMQVLGGYGYVAEYGLEQQLRDLRIALVYEGTNEIQAIDLVQRKILADDGAGLRALLVELESTVAQAAARPALAEAAAAVAACCADARAALPALRAAREADPQAPLRAADDLLQALGWTLLGWAWLAMALAAADGGDAARAQDKATLARYGAQWLLPQARLHWAAAVDGGRVLP
jgi:alkylation response protein AidB-like acyl-CoA dehydrogenase